jgi:glycosyltransferase involved in cell wall biosynthesis
MVCREPIMKKPLVSVNIRTFNSAKTLPETLDSVKKQTYSNIEIVISDGYSKDRTVEIAEKYGATITYEKELGDARYKVFTSSRGDFVLSLDSDQVMEKNLISECVEMCLEYKFDALIISEKSLIIQNTFLEKLIAYDKYLIDKDRNGNKFFDNACPRFFDKKLLLSVNWPKRLSIFDDSILYALLLRLKAKIGYLKSSSIFHHEVGSWPVFIKKFYRYGQGYFRALRVSPKIVSIHSLPRRSYFSKRIMKKPEYILPIFFLYFVKISAAGVGALAHLLKGDRN